jgi:hypothetical protein
LILDPFPRRRRRARQKTVTGWIGAGDAGLLPPSYPRVHEIQRSPCCRSASALAQVLSSPIPSSAAANPSLSERSGARTSSNGPRRPTSKSKRPLRRLRWQSVPCGPIPGHRAQPQGLGTAASVARGLRQAFPHRGGEEDRLRASAWSPRTPLLPSPVVKTASARSAKSPRSPPRPARTVRIKQKLLQKGLPERVARKGCRVVVIKHQRSPSSKAVIGDIEAIGRRRGFAAGLRPSGRRIVNHRDVGHLARPDLPLSETEVRRKGSVSMTSCA